MPPVVRLSKPYFDALPEYSCSVPTLSSSTNPMTASGVMKWKRQKVYGDDASGWLLGEYKYHWDDSCWWIHWAAIEVALSNEEAATVMRKVAKG